MRILLVCTAMLTFVAGASGARQAQMQAAPPPTEPSADTLQTAAEGRLARPDIERWVFLGATVDHGVVPEDGTRKFSADDPGMILVTKMEPAAYDYFKANRRYADGTTFATSIYKPHEDPKPEMDGVVQGDLAVLFVHRLERDGQGMQHVFYVFPNGEGTAMPRPAGNECVACHTENGALDGTYVQFYPVLREQLRAGEGAAEADDGGPDNPESVVQRQLEAFNAHDIDAFVATYSPDIEVFVLGGERLAEGHEAMRVFYGSRFEAAPTLKAELMNRIVRGNYVIDHEHLTGYPDGSTFDGIAIYELHQGKIRRVWFPQ